MSRSARVRSRTALGIAVARALERERPPEQRIVDDPYARHFVGEGVYRLLKFFYNRGWAERKGPGVFEYLVARERAIDDFLLREAASGIDQLVILGAGYDSRAWRFARPLQGTRVFEVDLPASQATKREKVSHFSDEVEVDVTWVPVDFTRDTLADELARARYSRAARTLFIWQGVLMYLSRESADATLRTVRDNAAPGSAIVLDYISTERLGGASGAAHGEVKTTNRYGRSSGERLQLGLDPAQAPEWLAVRGFVDVEHIRSEELHSRYFHGANAERVVTSGYGILFGRVPQE
jgi:methyltransferase (TIGR00027 family)